MSEVTLPPSIQRQIDAAEALQKQMMAPVEQPADTSTEPTPAPEPQTVEPEQVVTTQPAAPVAPEVDWKHRYETLQGKYNAEVPRLNEQNRVLGERLNQLAAELQQLKARPVEPPKAPEPVVSDKEKQEYGEDLIEVMQRVAAHSARQVAAEAAKVVEPVKRELEQVQAHQRMTAEELFFARLKEQVPDYQQVDARDDWKLWLLQRAAPGVAFTRQDALQAAYTNGDVGAMAELFNAFKSTLTPAPAVPSPQAELARQVAPARSKAASAPVGEKVWTMAEYESAFDVRKNRDKSADEVAQLQAEADRALAEGRIRF